ncbi:MAG: Xaa-Pro peptidase family protein [Thermoplasmata archaeon]|nr:Xaa-Pro peptidase family protein [Thermoplasmata archaeon]
MQKHRLEKILGNLKEDVDVIVLRNATEPNIDPNFFYVADISYGLFEGCICLIWKDGEVEILTTKLEAETAKHAKVPITVFGTREERARILKKKIGKAKKVGINFENITHQGYLDTVKATKKAKVVDVSEALRKARMIKDPTEIERIAKACTIASKVADEIPTLVKESGMKETEVVAEINYLMTKYGANSPSFETIVAFGKNAAEPHYTACTGTLRKGDFVLCDFGARYLRYCSDITRTFVAGKATKEQERMYEVVLEAHDAAIDFISAGKSAKECHKAAEDVINRSRYRGKFTHGLGHGLGLTVHDPGGMSPSQDIVLEPNMILTVEPGIYIPKIGGVRIEDDILVTKDGCKVLTEAESEFREIRVK